MNKIIKWSKKLFLVIATFVIMLSSMTNANAAAETIQLISAKQSGKYIAGVSFSYKRTAEIDYYYCLNIHKNTAQNVEAKLVKSGSVVDGGIVHILKNGYPYKTVEELGVETQDDAYFATMQAINCVLRGYTLEQAKAQIEMQNFIDDRIFVRLQTGENGTYQWHEIKQIKLKTPDNTNCKTIVIFRNIVVVGWIKIFKLSKNCCIVFFYPLFLCKIIQL